MIRSQAHLPLSLPFLFNQEFTSNENSIISSPASAASSSSSSPSSNPRNKIATEYVRIFDDIAVHHDDHRITSDNDNANDTKVLKMETLPGFKIQNIIATADLRCHLNLKTIALHAKNAEYNPKRFTAVIIRIHDPRTTTLVFSTGKLVITGARDEESSLIAARKITRIIHKIGFPTTLSYFKIQNMVGTWDVQFLIRVEGLNADHDGFSSYEPELFPGLIYNMIQPKVTFLIFVSGKIVVTGAKTREIMKDAFKRIYPVLEQYKKS